MANPFVHVELNTSEIDKAKSFYGSLFDWKLDDVSMGPAGTYTMVQVGEGTGGGMFNMPGMASTWLPYVLVDDIHAATKKAKSLGAHIVKDVTEIAGTGWLSIFTDPTGAMLGLWQATRKG